MPSGAVRGISTLLIFLVSPGVWDRDKIGAHWIVPGAALAGFLARLI
jgi:hypothetical protein